MTTHSILVRPGAGQSLSLTTGPAARLEFAFDQADATLSRDGQNLVFTFNDGAVLTLQDFYDNFGDNAQPPVMIVQGNEVPGEDFLAAFDDPDLMPAAGPAVVVGGGLYEDVFLYDVQGVGRLGKLSFDGESGRSVTVEGVESLSAPAFDEPGYASLAPGGGAPPPPGGGTEPELPPPPVEPPYQPPYNEYVARGVFYNTGLEVDLLSVDYNARAAAKAGTHPGSVTFAFYDADGNPIDNPCGTADYDPVTGRITFGTPRGEGIYYCVITDDAGKSYSMQLVADPDRNFDSHDQDAATPPLGDTLWYGEWHAGRGDSRDDSEYHVVSSDLNDTLTFTGVHYGMNGSSLNTGGGDDTIAITAAGVGNGITYGVKDTSITTGAGDDSINITATAGDAGAQGMSGSSLDAGDGKNSISISAAGSGSGIDNWVIGFTAGMHDSTLTAAGDSTISIEAGNTGWGRAFGMDKSTITLGAGDNRIDISATAEGGDLGMLHNAYGMYSGPNVTDLMALGEGGKDCAIVTGDGNNTINITATSISEDRSGLYGDAYGISGGYYANRSNITTGAGNDSINISATARGDAYGMYKSDIDTGAGDDTITISAVSKDGVDQKAYGMAGSTIAAGAGDNTISITATAIGGGFNTSAYGMSDINYNHNGSSIKTGDGNDSISITATASRNANGMYRSSIDTGGGNDSISITASSGNARDGVSDNAYGMRESTIDVGNGNNSINITASGGSYETSNTASGINSSSAYGMRDSTIAAGNGNTSINISASAGSFAAGMRDSGIITGTGDSDINISAVASNGPVNGMQDSTIDVGNGTNSINISASGDDSTVSSGQIQNIAAMRDSGITATGDNTININIRNTGAGFTYGMADSTITTDGGASSISINAESAVASQWGKGIAYGMNNSGISATGYTKDESSGRLIGNTITINAANDTGSAIGMGGSTIKTGDGDDTINTANDTGSTIGMSGSTIKTGDGDDSINITGGGMSGSSIDTGNGNDTISINAGTGMFGGSKINLGDGDNIVTITAASIGMSADGSSDKHHSSIKAGDGDNTISINAGYIGMYDSDIATGDGDNAIRITAGSNNREAIGLYGDGSYMGYSSIKTGDGDDSISISAASDRAEAMGIINSTIDAGAGANSISISASGDAVYDAEAHWTLSGHVTGMQDSTLTATGDNTISIEATNRGDGLAFGLNNSGIATGAGDDSISISAVAKGSGAAYGMNDSSISTGDGNDAISISAEANDRNYAMYNSSLSTGAGDDAVAITGDILSTTDNHSIDLGAGNDSLMLKGGNVSGMLLDGGANDELVFAQELADGGYTARLGDILGLGGGAIGDLSGNTIRNFESLLVDIDTVGNLDDLLNSFCKIREAQNAGGIGGTGDANGNNTLQALIVTGNGEAVLSDTGRMGTCINDGVHIEGVEGSFSHYQTDDGYGHQLHLYIQTSLA